MITLNSNTKLKLDGILKWSLPAGKTCPGADFKSLTSPCRKCFAINSMRLYPSVRPCHMRNYAHSLKASFVADMVQALKAKRKLKYFRIHDSGDFYSAHYLQKWFDICRQCPEIQFYAYTKSHEYFLNESGEYIVDMPANFRVIHSLGSKRDDLVNVKKHRHAFVFHSYDDMLAVNYVNCADSDLVAATTDSLYIGLVYLDKKKAGKK